MKEQLQASHQVNTNVVRKLSRLIWFAVWGVLDTALCDQVYQWFATGGWFSPGTLVSSTNKTDCHDIAKILLKGVLNNMTPDPIWQY